MGSLLLLEGFFPFYLGFVVSHRSDANFFVSVSESNELQLLSCGADKSIIFRTAQQVS